MYLALPRKDGQFGCFCLFSPTQVRLYSIHACLLMAASSLGSRGTPKFICAFTCLGVSENSYLLPCLSLSQFLPHLSQFFLDLALAFRCVCCMFPILSVYPSRSHQEIDVIIEFS